MRPVAFLRLEGVLILGLALSGYLLLDGPLWLLLVLALAADLAMIGYLVNAGVGGLTYNVVHTYVLPVALAGIGLWASQRILVLGALVWIGHIGLDRFLGFGLKHASEFGDTHLS